MFGKNKTRIFIVLATLVIWAGSPAILQADDTEIYKTNLRPNVAIMFDSSGSMDFGVYDSSVDYGFCYNYASEQGDYDLIAGGGGGTNNYFYAPDGPGTGRQYPRNEILLVKGNIGVSIHNGRSYTGDPGDPDYLWYTSNVIHTYTFIDADGNLYGDGEHTQRLTVNGEGVILLDGVELPLDRSIKLHDWQTNPDGTLVDRGFGGQINAPGWYFSGMEEIGSDASSHNPAEDGDINVYFFIPGNWINMQMMYNLYTSSYMDEDNRTWKVRAFPKDGELNNDWHTVVRTIKTINYPNDYPDPYPNPDNKWEIVQSDAAKIRLHFVNLAVEAGDRLVIYKDSINSNNKLEIINTNGSDFWRTYELGSKHNLKLVFRTDKDSSADQGFFIDKYEYLSTGEVAEGYRMQRRIDVVREAILYVIEGTRGKINWALASFSVNPTGNGAKIWQPFDPTLDDDTVRQNIITYINALEPNGGTPLGEAMQDLFNHFESKKDVLPECTRNYTIVLSDGFPSADSDWNRISGESFTDRDGDGWTEDPYQYAYPPQDFFDDVAHFMYTTSFRDRSEIPSAELNSSYDNITTHTLSFIQGVPLLENASEEAGGIYLAAYNRQQLINAFYSLGLLIIKSTSYVAPVISVDTSNKTQSGDYLYMAFFKPRDQQWTGNLKKYHIIKAHTSCNMRQEEEWVPVDQNGDVAVDCDGNFIASSTSFWSSEEDGGEVELGGVGQVLKEALKNADLADPYAYRNIIVLKKDGVNVPFVPENISNADLTVEDDADRYKIINYIYGYTFAEDGTADHKPVAKRSWPLGSLVHSTPTVINYEAAEKTYIVIGGNDGMLHVFDDDNGQEVVAYIFENQLTALKHLDPEDNAFPEPKYFVDGPITFLYTFDADGKITPSQLIVGERRGGRAYYALDIANSNPSLWSKSWVIDNSVGGFSELGQTWSKVSLAKLKTAADSYLTVGVFGAGYDPEEDNDPAGADTMGRGIFVVDINKTETDGGFLVHHISYSPDSTDNAHQMTFAVPADPTIITDQFGFLTDIIFADLGGQVWKVSYDNSSYSWGAPHRIFTANPGSQANSGETGGTLDANDNGRKMFYSPAVTFLGHCNYLDDSDQQRDYYTYFLCVGTGDREKPKNIDNHDRIYCFLDATDENKVLDERDLLNVTDDELDVDSGIDPEDRTTLENRLRETYGWYIKLDEIPDNREHEGEKILAAPVTFYGITYFTSYTPLLDDPCFPHGESKVYGLNYCDGTAGLNYNLNNDEVSGNDRNEKYDLTDRYRTIGEAIPSGVKIVIREGKVAAFISVGGKLSGGGVAGSPNIPQPSCAIDMINWREIFGQ